MKLIQIAVIMALYFFVVGCSAPVIAPVKVELTKEEINYLSDVKPILDRRCVTCHSCYNAPCQTKFSSFEGVDRGATKIVAYDALRLRAIDPTRLFTDAQTTEEWHSKGFYSTTTSPDSNETHNDSTMIHMLYDKKINPDIVGSYNAETDERICPRNKEELNEYMDEKKNHGMPYGFPAIKEKEYETIAQWLQRGAYGPTAAQQKKLETPSEAAAIEIKKWETFLNTEDAKHSVTARYLYEHLFLAHWNFKSAPTEFYEIVRSSTPYPQKVEVIASLRPYDNPKVEKFYYRFVKIHSTIVFKTHIVLEFDDETLDRYKELFIEPMWVEKPHYIDYEVKMSANPFVAFYQIPAESRYQFLLDNSHYIITTFIRGSVCRGQMALNVIHDHFWIMFADPASDLSLNNLEFMKSQLDNLSMPIETSQRSVFQTFSDAYRDKYDQYFIAKEELYDKTYPEGLGLESIWKGEKPTDAPLMTIYRHFNSASVHKGVLGELPRTMWVIDYPQLERIYYSLVSGYDIFGNVSHQTNIRRYMDFLRMEGELNFISYMPSDTRLEMFKSWYINDGDIENMKESSSEFSKRSSKIEYKTEDYKSEFIEQVVNKHILKSTGIAFDDVNYYKAGDKPPTMPKEFHTEDDIRDGVRSLTAPGTGFITHVVDNDMNTILIRVIRDDGSSFIRTIVINRWHDNVNSLFNGEQVNPEKDTMDILVGSIGSYPNMFSIVHEKDLPDFFDVLKNFDKSDKYKAKLAKYFIGRDDDKFWDHFDWFQDNFNESDPLRAGLYDLNRYYVKGWKEYGY